MILGEHLRTQCIESGVAAGPLCMRSEGDFKVLGFALPQAPVAYVAAEEAEPAPVAEAAPRKGNK
jgi:hypothetical protein